MSFLKLLRILELSALVRKALDLTPVSLFTTRSFKYLFSNFLCVYSCVCGFKLVFLVNDGLLGILRVLKSFDFGYC